MTRMKVPFFELISQFRTIEGEVRSALDEVFATQQFIMGQKVEALEKEVAEYCGSRFGIGVASGSDALLLSLMALGIRPGEEVLLPPSPFLRRQALFPAWAPPLFSWTSKKRRITWTLLESRRRSPRKRKPSFRCTYTDSVRIWIPFLTLPGKRASA